MRVDAFDFALPKHLIADRPREPREAARLLHVAPERLEDARIADLPRLLRRGDLLVVNDTRVLPVRLAGRRGAARIEATLHRRLDATRWRAFVKGARRLRRGDHIVFADDFAAEVAALGEAGEVELAFAVAPQDFAARLEAHGAMPLPPYIKRPAGGDPRDRRDYQTMFAAREGAVAAPTAGLHFTPELLAQLAAAGIAWTAVTLHVGAGTFLPVKAEDTRQHRMHAEWGEIAAAVASRINAAREAGGRIVAVGTTALRLVESASGPDGVAPFAGETDLFITPGYRFKTIDVLFTNFHLPRSTLFMLVSAFAGLARMQAAYAHAIAAGYRFFSYGDACLIERGAP